MDDQSAEILRTVCEIRDLVRLMAEPAIAARDQRLRDELLRIVGRSSAKIAATLLMDGNCTQQDICKKTSMNQGNLSTFVKQLKAAKLLSGDGKQPKLAIMIPANFFDTGKTNE